MAQQRAFTGGGAPALGRMLYRVAIGRPMRRRGRVLSGGCLHRQPMWTGTKRFCLQCLPINSAAVQPLHHPRQGQCAGAAGGHPGAASHHLLFSAPPLEPHLRQGHGAGKRHCACVVVGCGRGRWAARRIGRAGAAPATRSCMAPVSLAAGCVDLERCGNASTRACLRCRSACRLPVRCQHHASTHTNTITPGKQRADPGGQPRVPLAVQHSLPLQAGGLYSVWLCWFRLAVCGVKAMEDWASCPWPWRRPSLLQATWLGAPWRSSLLLGLLGLLSAPVQASPCRVCSSTDPASPRITATRHIIHPLANRRP